jgi:hypothetical protein
VLAAHAHCPQVLEDEPLQRRQVPVAGADVREALVRPDQHRREQHPPVGELAAVGAAQRLDDVGDLAAGVDTVD